MKKQFDRSSHVVKYNVDDWVYVWKPAPEGCDHRKFYDHFRGPFKIVSKVTEYTYRIALGIEKFDIVHMEKLKLAKPPSPVALETRTTAMEDRPIVVESTTDNHHAIIDQPFVWVPPLLDEQTSPCRNRTPVKRLVYAENFAQTKQ